MYALMLGKYHWILDSYPSNNVYVSLTLFIEIVHVISIEGEEFSGLSVARGVSAEDKLVLILLH